MHVLAALSLAVLSVPAMAGGIGIKLTPVTSSLTKAPKAVVLVESAGCVAIKDLEMTASLEKMEDGKRKSVPVKLIRLSDDQVAIEQTWAAESGWALVVRAKANGMSTEAAAQLDAAGKPFIVRDKGEQSKIAAKYYWAEKMKDADLQKILSTKLTQVSSRSN
jgi:hypothetical protein